MASGVTIKAHAGPLRRALTANSTAASYAAHLPTITAPVSSATVKVFGDTEGPRATTAEITPFGTAANNLTGSVLVLGWNSTVGTATPLWVPRIICDVACIVSATLTGAANSDVLVTEFFADTLTLTFGTAGFKQGTGDADIASFLCDVSSFQRWSVQFKIGTATDVNALVKEY